jgi:putative Holliday junction resolvase
MNVDGTVLAFDYGEKRIGVANGQTVTCTAAPLATITVTDQRPDWTAIETLIAQWRPALLVVGLPLNMDGTEHAMTVAARRFAAKLHGRYKLPVEMVDERLSSVAAEEQLRDSRLGKQKRRQKESVDQFAAQVILMSWFGTRGG